MSAVLYDSLPWSQHSAHYATLPTGISLDAHLAMLSKDQGVSYGMSQAYQPSNQRDNSRYFNKSQVNPAHQSRMDSHFWASTGNFSSPYEQPGFPNYGSGIADPQNQRFSQGSPATTGNSRSARMRRALSVPTRQSVPTPQTPAIRQQPQYHTSPVPVGPLGAANELLRMESVDYINAFGPSTPPRLQTRGGKNRTRPWRTTEGDRPPRFRNGPSAPNSPSLLASDATKCREGFSNQIPVISHPSRSSHILSNSPSNNVQYSSGIPHTRSQRQDRKPLQVIPQPNANLAPIGSERAQRLSSGLVSMPVNLCKNSNNLSNHSHLANIGPPPGLVKSSPRPHPSQLQQPAVGPTVNANTLPSRIDPTKDVKVFTGPSELERLYIRTRKSRSAPKVSSPLAPFRNPDTLVVSDGKWRRHERDQRRQHFLTCCDNSTYKRKANEARSRIECEEFVYGVDVSDHCLRCRQDTLCKRLLVQRAREFLRLASSSPTSEWSSSSDEELLTPIDVIPHLPSLKEKAHAFGFIQIVDPTDDVAIPDSPPHALALLAPI